MRILLFITLLLTSTLSAEYTQKVKMPSITFKMAEDDNFKAMQRNCQWCHSYGYILNQGKQSKEFWNKSVVKMREVYKAPISVKDEITITNYLFKHYGNGKLQ
ncbi:sulfite:cytochrome C oxidoreductase subunit B [Sulfurimonas sp.]|uniref:sulfite:cytochrome C oxidoreductase subunit B n=1 Tax=Sulfurimonas sp. TaxID=2022749 RepID=UPI003566498A